MSINRMYYGTKKIYSFLENGNSGGNTGGDCPQINLGEGWITITANESGQIYEMFASEDGYDGWSKFTVEVEDLGNPEVTIRNAQEIVDGVNDGWYEITENKVLVKGQITEIQRIRPEYRDARYTIDNCFNVYNGYYNEEIQIGDYVVVEGVVSLYNGAVQFSAGSNIKAQFRCQGGSSEGGSNPFTELGWADEDVNNMLQEVDDYAIRKMQEWDASSDSANEYFREDPYDNRTERLVFAPMLDTRNVTHFGLMFYGCKCLVGVPKYNTSNATFFAEMFGECQTIKSIPDFDTRNVNDFTNCFKSCSVLSEGPNWDFGNAASVRDLFAFCSSLTTIPRYNFSNVSDIGEFFGYYGDEMAVVYLGGFEGLKSDWNDGNGLDRCPNLTYESIMNVINDLYDFRGNGDNDTTRTLKINTNTMALLSDEDKQIAINKGWMLTE